MNTVEEAWRQRMANLEVKVKAVEAHVAGQRTGLPPQHAPYSVQLSNVPFAQQAFRPPSQPSQSQFRSPCYVPPPSHNSSYGTQRLRPGTTHTYRSAVRSKSPHRTPYDRPRSEHRPGTSRHSNDADDRRHSVSSSNVAPQHHARSVTKDYRQSASPSDVSIKGEDQRRYFSEHPPKS